MAKGLSSMGGVTLERSKLDLSKEIKTREPNVDNAGGGGNSGKNIFNGGGGDGGDDDDDDYFGNFDDGEGDGDGGGFFRTALKQVRRQGSVSHSALSARKSANLRRASGAFCIGSAWHT